MFKRKAFTLLELLVVIGIIAVLMTILLPVMKKVRHEARAAACLSNQRQLGLAFVLYIEQNDRKAMISSLTVQYNWMALLQPYCANIDRLRFCPEAPQINPFVNVPVQATVGTAFSGWGSNPADPLWLGGYQGSYGLNCWVYPTGYPGNPTVLVGVLDDYFNSYPASGCSQIPLFGDCIWMGSFPQSTDSVPADLLNGDIYNLMGRFCIARHGKAINLTFYDGHSERVELARLWQLKWSKRFQPRQVVVP